MATENYLLTISGSCQGQYNACVQCYQSAGLASNDTLTGGADLVSAWITHMRALWLAMLPQSYYLDLLSARRAFPKPSVTVRSQFPAFTVLGTRGANAAAYNLCPSIFLVPPMGTKSGGRTFLPCAAKGDVVDNGKNAGYIAAYTAYFNAAIAGFAGSGTNWKLAIYSRKNISASLATSFSPSPVMGFQGRRRSPAGSA